MKKSANAKFATKNLGTSILLRPNSKTVTTTALPRRANKNTIQIPHRRVHHPKRSSHGMNGPGSETDIAPKHQRKGQRHTGGKEEKEEEEEEEEAK